MRLSYHLNSKGITLIELLVAMGLSTMLLVTVVSGGLFLEKYINQWKNQARLSEEIVLVRQTMESLMRDSRRVVITDTSVTCAYLNSSTHKLTWSRNVLSLQAKPLLRKGVLVDSFSITPLGLHHEVSPNILATDGSRHNRGLYQISVALSEGNKQSRSATFIVRNRYEQVSYDQ
jgi:type II secretory pathway pseudopilin PulG